MQRAATRLPIPIHLSGPRGRRAGLGGTGTLRRRPCTSSHSRGGHISGPCWRDGVAVRDFRAGRSEVGSGCGWRLVVMFGVRLCFHAVLNWEVNRCVAVKCFDPSPRQTKRPEASRLEPLYLVGSSGGCRQPWNPCMCGEGCIRHWSGLGQASTCHMHSDSTLKHMHLNDADRHLSTYHDMEASLSTAFILYENPLVSDAALYVLTWHRHTRSLAHTPRLQRHSLLGEAR